MNEKRQEIIQKVRELYKTYGIKSVSMDDVAHQLGMSKKTVYQFFQDKDELVRAVVECDFEHKQLESRFGKASELNAIEEVVVYYKLQIEIIKDHKPTFAYDLKKYYPTIFEDVKQKMRERILNITKANLIKGKSEGIYRNELDEDIVAKLNLMRIEGIIHGDLFEPEERTSARLFTEIYKYHMFAIVNDRGREILEKHLVDLNQYSEI